MEAFVRVLTPSNGAVAVNLTFSLHGPFPTTPGMGRSDLKTLSALNSVSPPPHVQRTSVG
jgi:hypothetical protein